MQVPCFLTISIRGYAMSEGERDETAAGPFCGFNTGSTIYRATPLGRLLGRYGGR